MATTTNLASNELEALEKFKDALAHQFGLTKLILYGSKARGESNRDSDLDVLVVLAERPDWRLKRGIYRLGFRVGMEFDVLLQPVVLCESDYASAKFQATPLLQNVALEGIEL